VKFNSFLPVQHKSFLKVKKTERFVFSQAPCPLQGILATAKKKNLSVYSISRLAGLN